MSGGVVVSDRRKAILLLAGSLYDFMPTPRGASFKQRAGKRKSASHYEPCIECGGTWLEGEHTGNRAGHRKGSGVKRDRFKREVPCETCGGYVDDEGRIVPGAGLIAIDAMTGRQVGTETTYAPPAKESWACPVCSPIKNSTRGTGVEPHHRDAKGKPIACRACGGSGMQEASKGVRFDMKPSTDDTDVTLTAVEKGIIRRTEIGSYHELDVCLSELARRSPHRHRVFHAVHVVLSESPGMLHPTQASLLDQAVRDLDEWMPDRIVVPAEVLAGQRLLRQDAPKGSNAPKGMLTTRDREIQHRRTAGASIGDIMAEFNLKKSQVYEIVAEVEAA